MSLKICRGCLIESKNLKNIFALKIEIDYVHNLNFSDCFKICTDILIEKSDKLPQKICDQCIESLVAAYEYRTQCKKSDLKLKSKNLKNIVSVINEEQLYLSDNDGDNCNIDSTCDVSDYPVEENVEEEIVMIIEKLDEPEEDLLHEEHLVLPETESYEEPESLVKLEASPKFIIEKLDRPDEEDLYEELETICVLPETETYEVEPDQSLIKLESIPIFQCKICNHKLENLKALQIHLNAVHNIYKELVNFETTDAYHKYDCKICGKVFDKRHRFLYHMRRHRQIYPCTICCKY